MCLLKSSGSPWPNELEEDPMCLAGSLDDRTSAGPLGPGGDFDRFLGCAEGSKHVAHTIWIGGRGHTWSEGVIQELLEGDLDAVWREHGNTIGRLHARGGNEGDDLRSTSE
jgi:hypothetical protein